jgi:hypothetical protein
MENLPFSKDEFEPVSDKDGLVSCEPWSIYFSTEKLANSNASDTQYANESK